MVPQCPFPGESEGYPYWLVLAVCRLFHPGAILCQLPDTVKLNWTGSP